MTPCYHALPEQTKPSRSITKMVLLIHQFYLGLAMRGSCQIGLHRVWKPHVEGLIPRLMTHVLHHVLQLHLGVASLANDLVKIVGPERRLHVRSRRDRRRGEGL